MYQWLFTRILRYSILVSILILTILMLIPSSSAAKPSGAIQWSMNQSLRMHNLSALATATKAANDHATIPACASIRWQGWSGEKQQLRKVVHSCGKTVKVTRSYIVKAGESLSSIAFHEYGNSAYWPILFRANRKHITDYNSINIGQRLKIPPKPAKFPKIPAIQAFSGGNSASNVGNYGGHGPPVSGKAGIAVAFAYAQLGCPYVWGGNGPCQNGFDCSGLMQQAWLAAGITIPRVSYDQIGQLRGVSLHALRPGDILGMYGNSHVGMYVGGGMMIDAPVPGAVVEKVPVPWGAVDAAVRP
jgi:cell wall-associated NlpC family hydrolase